MAKLSNQADNSLGLSSIDKKPFFQDPQPVDFISKSPGNLLALGNTDAKLRIGAKELISMQRGNDLTSGYDGKLYVQAGEGGGVTNPAELVSTDIRNKLTLGSDLLLYVPSTVVDGQVDPADLISAEADNNLTLGFDDLLYVPPAEVSASTFISTDTGNSIKKGSDGLLFTRVPAIATDAQLTLENTTMTPSAAQLTGVYNRVTALEAGGGSGTVDLSSVVPITRTITTTAPLTGGGNLSANRTLAISTATTSAKGVVQLATLLEAEAGTDSTKVLTPQGGSMLFAGSIAFTANKVSALTTRVDALETSLGDISTALAAILRA